MLRLSLISLAFWLRCNLLCLFSVQLLIRLASLLRRVLGY